MKNLAPISFCLVLASLISGCDPTLSTMAKGASKELGTPFSVRTDDSDECATKQLAILTRDYLALDAVTKDQIKAQLKAYESVIIEASLSTGSHFRQVAVVLEPNSQFGFGYDSDNGHYPIAGNTIVSTEGRSIALQAQQMVIMVVRSDYRAVNDQARRSIYDWQSFLKAQQAGEVIPTGDHLDTSSVDCGPLVSLRELAKY